MSDNTSQWSAAESHSQENVLLGELFHVSVDMFC